MRSILVFAGLVAADAMFDDPMGHAQMKREMLEPRQSIPDLSPSCTSALLGIYNGIPTPPARLVTALGAGNDNPCSVTVPSSLSSDYSSYESQIGSWYSGNSDDVSSALSSCPELSKLATLLPVCVTSYLGGGAAASGSGTNTASGASNTGSSSASGGSANSQTTDTGSASATGASATGTDTGAASRETGFAVAALAAAGAIAAAL